MFDLEMVTFSAKFDFFVERDRVLVAGVRFEPVPDLTDGPLPDRPFAVPTAAQVWEDETWRDAVRATLLASGLHVLYERCRRGSGDRPDRFRIRPCA